MRRPLKPGLDWVKRTLSLAFARSSKWLDTRARRQHTIQLKLMLVPPKLLDLLVA